METNSSLGVDIEVYQAVMKGYSTFDALVENLNRVLIQFIYQNKNINLKNLFLF